MSTQRYSIHGAMIIDSESNPVHEIYIRELLDMPSMEFQHSRLDARQKQDVIQAIGLETLIKVLDQCFKAAGKNYDAAQEAESAVLLLGKAVVRQSQPMSSVGGRVDE